MTEETPSTGNGQGHGAKFPQDTVPFGHRDPLLHRWYFVKKLLQALAAMRREFERALNRVQ
jgi:hypothetical protein